MLPEGWRFRGNEKKPNSKHFLSYEVTMFKSYRKAQEYISSFMSEMDLERFAAYADGESKVNRNSSYEWVDDPSLPKGWRSRFSESKKFYLAPTSEQFPVRRLVLKFMVEKNYPEEDLEKTRSSLGEEGWRGSTLLPEGWRFRPKEKSKSGAKDFLTKDGMYFKSFKTAREYAAANCSPAEVMKLDEFAEGESKVNRTSSYEWVDDPSLPKGWRRRFSESKKFYLAPTNEQFPVRRLVLKFMVEKNYPEEDLEKTRSSLGEEGWRGSTLLPEGWRFRPKEKSKSGAKDFLTKDGMYFKSFKTSKQYATANCSPAEVTMLDEFALEESRRSRLSEVSYNWEKDDSLPEGWKLRRIKGPKGKVFLLAPNGDSFPTRQSALRFLIQNEMKQSDIEKMREGLHCENWLSHNLLPKGWKMRSAGKDKNSKVFLTREAKFISGYKQAAIFIKESKKLSKRDSERFVHTYE